jgi:cobalt-zinc-cadmium efflux system membrane fusion protein
MKSKKSIITVAVAAITLIFVVMMFKEKKLPSVAEVPVTAAVQHELCAKHQLPVAECFFCDPALRELGRLWCEEHERYEDRCFICHPEIKEVDRLWCEEHKLYEDECFFCHPELRKAQNESKGKEATIPTETKVKTLSSNELQCLEHGVLEKECGICHPELIATLQPGQGLKIRLESPESAVKAGVRTSIPTTGSSLAGRVVLSRVSYDQNRLARITPLAAGVVQRVLADVGDSVSKGRVLVEIVSPEIARAKSDYLSGLANEALKELVFKREKGLVEKEISSQQEYEQALAEYQMARNTTTMTGQQLLNYGLTEQQIREVVETRSSSSRLPILAPFSGTLVDRNAVVGEAVKPGDMLFTLADLSSMWLELSVPEDRLPPLKVDDLVEATFDALPGATVRGRLIWLASSIDEQSRMMKARAIVPNPGSLLKHGMFGQVRILPKRNLKGLHVPVDALHRFDGIPFIFVKLARDLYEIRRVTLGGKDRESVEILEGAVPPEEVVVTHSFTLKSEFLKSRLGAGCVDE